MILHTIFTNFILIFSLFYTIIFLINSFTYNFIFEGVSEVQSLIYTLSFMIFTPLLQEKLINAKTITIKYMKDRKPPFKIPTPVIPSNFSPWFITSYADAECCFYIHLVKRSGRTTGYAVQFKFVIHINAIETTLLSFNSKIF